MCSVEEESIGDPFYLSLRRIRRPEDRPARPKSNPMDDFGVPPDPCSIPWTGGTSAVGALTANSTFKGCALTVISRD